MNLQLRLKNFIVQVHRNCAEEAHLVRLFPQQFRSYQKEVPRFFPRLSLRLAGSFSFAKYLSNREYNTAVGFLAALGILIGKYWRA